MTTSRAGDFIRWLQDVDARIEKGDRDTIMGARQLNDLAKDLSTADAIRLIQNEAKPSMLELASIAQLVRRIRQKVTEIPS